MSTTEPFAKLKLLLDQYIQLFQELEQTEAKKTGAAENYDIELLNQCMKEEQAFILKMRGYEKRRQDLFQVLHVSSDVCLTKLLPCLPADRQKQFDGQFKALKDSYDSFHIVYQKAGEILKKNGRVIDGELKWLSALAPAPYTAVGKRKKEPSRSITNLQI